MAMLTMLHCGEEKKNAFKKDFEYFEVTNSHESHQPNLGWFHNPHGRESRTSSFRMSTLESLDPR